MDSLWWPAGSFICGACTVIGSIGNGLTIAIFIKYPQFQNTVGTLIFRLVKKKIISRNALIGINVALQFPTYCSAYLSRQSMPSILQILECGISAYICAFFIT